MQLIQITVLPILTNGTITKYLLLGLDTEGKVWRRDPATNSWIADTATFTNN